jgi:hypothetical protein
VRIVRMSLPHFSHACYMLLSSSLTWSL